jgi:TPR repeat protein
VRFLFLFVTLLAFAAPALADGIKYYSDPVYQKLAPEDEHPMDDLIKLAEQGDVRAQYILGDMFGKGKGGLGRNLVKSRYWFETAALRGYDPAFVRLAALAKRQKDWVEAYKWYTLGVNHTGGKLSRWCKKARENLKISRAQEDEAKKAAREWDSRQSANQQALREKEKMARDAAALELKNSPDMVKIEKHTANAKQYKYNNTTQNDNQQPRQEHKYND